MELGVLILLGTLLTSNTGFALVSQTEPAGMKLLNQLLREEARKGNRGEKEPLQPVASLPLGPASPGPQGTPIPGYEQSSRTLPLEADSGGGHRRQRRCTCYTYKDKECVYYCHLDIIWVNTPERVVPYGLSNYRGKRSTGRTFHSSEFRSRCWCEDQRDYQCFLFCAPTENHRDKPSAVWARDSSTSEQVTFRAVA